MGWCSGGSSKTSTKYSRYGKTSGYSWSDPPSRLTDLLLPALQGASVPSTLAGKENDFIQELLNKNWTDLPGYDNMRSVAEETPGSGPAVDALKGIAAVDPYSPSYYNELSSYYDTIMGEAAAKARTGPDNVRGGEAHGSMIEADALERAGLGKAKELFGMQQQQAKTTTDAATALGQVEAQRRATSLSAQDALVKEFLQGLGLGLEGIKALDTKRTSQVAGDLGAVNTYGTKRTDTLDNTSGEGWQNNTHHNMGLGIQCCFIFAEAWNGPLPWYVRRGRDLLATKESVRGYKRMARWLVPLMHRYPATVGMFVNMVLIRPFMLVGAWYFNAEGARPVGRYLRPVCEMWLKVWTILGRR